MGEGSTRADVDFDDACSERDRLERELEDVRVRQESLVLEALDRRVLPRLRELRPELKFAVDGSRARGLLLERDGRATPLVVLVTDDGWQLVERRAYGLNAVMTPIGVRAFVDDFGRDALPALAAALEAAERAAATAAAAESAATAMATAAASDRAPSSRPMPANGRARTGTVKCPACDASPNAENLARHLRSIHGIDPGARPVKRTSTPAHQFCRMCDARLPRGRLDAHMTIAHGVFHVHPTGMAADAKREARREAAKKAASRPSAGLRAGGGSGPASASRVAAPAGRDFLKETRIERTLVARAASPHHDRDRIGRFSDAPDVERMDGDSDA